MLAEFSTSIFLFTTLMITCEILFFERIHYFVRLRYFWERQKVVLYPLSNEENCFFPCAVVCVGEFVRAAR